MNLSEIKKFLKQRGQACLYDFVSNYGVEAGEIRSILEVHVKEGKVRKRIFSTCCNGGCQECITAEYEFYEWL